MSLNYGYTGGDLTSVIRGGYLAADQLGIKYNQIDGYKAKDGLLEFMAYDKMIGNIR